MTEVIREGVVKIVFHDDPFGSVSFPDNENENEEDRSEKRYRKKQIYRIKAFFLHAIC